MRTGSGSVGEAAGILEQRSAPPGTDSRAARWVGGGVREGFGLADDLHDAFADVAFLAQVALGAHLHADGGHDGVGVAVRGVQGVVGHAQGALAGHPFLDGVGVPEAFDLGDLGAPLVQAGDGAGRAGGEGAGGHVGVGVEDLAAGGGGGGQVDVQRQVDVGVGVAFADGGDDLLAFEDAQERHGADFQREAGDERAGFLEPRQRGGELGAHLGDVPGEAVFAGGGAAQESGLGQSGEVGVGGGPGNSQVRGERTDAPFGLFGAECAQDVGRLLKREHPSSLQGRARIVYIWFDHCTRFTRLRAARR